MKDVMKYQDYIATIHYSTKDEVFYGKIEGIDDLVSFEGDSVGALKLAFEEAVIDYLELCKLKGKEPEKAYRGTFNVRIKPELHKRAAREALMQDKTLNQYVEEAIEEYTVKK